MYSMFNIQSVHRDTTGHL